MKYISIIAILLVMCVLFAGCKDKEQADISATQAPTDNAGVPVETEPPEVVFNRNGVLFTLPGDFVDYSDSPIGAQYTFMYADAYIGVVGIEDFKEELSEEITTLEAYAAAQAAAFGGEAVEKNGVWTLAYEDLTMNEPQQYVCTFHETENAFWSIKSYCTSDTFEVYQQTMWNYVTSATFE